MVKPALNVDALTAEEKLELTDDIWASIGADDLPLTAEQQAELDRRLDRLDREGSVGTS